MLRGRSHPLTREGRLLSSGRMSYGEATENLQSAWEALLERQNQVGSDRKLADLALELIREMGNGTAQRDVLRRLVEAWTNDWRLTLTGAALLSHRAGRPARHGRADAHR